MEKEEDLISNWGIPLMGGSWISTIRSASVVWNSQTGMIEQEKVEINSSPSHSHLTGSTLLFSLRMPAATRDPLCILHLPWWCRADFHDLRHHSESSSWIMMIHSLTAGETVSIVCMIQQSIVSSWGLYTRREIDASSGYTVQLWDFFQRESGEKRYSS